MVSTSQTLVVIPRYANTLVMAQQANTFGQWLAAQMKERGFNQTSLGERARVSPQYIGSLVRGDRHSITGKPVIPTVESVDKIAKALGAPLSEARLAAGYAPIDKDVYQDQIEDEEIAFLASDYKELKQLTPEEEQAEIRAVIKMVRSELSKRLEAAKTKKKKK